MRVDVNRRLTGKEPGTSKQPKVVFDMNRSMAVSWCLSGRTAHLPSGMPLVRLTLLADVFQRAALAYIPVRRFLVEDVALSAYAVRGSCTGTFALVQLGVVVVAVALSAQRYVIGVRVETVLGVDSCPIARRFSGPTFKAAPASVRVSASPTSINATVKCPIGRFVALPVVVLRSPNVSHYSADFEDGASGPGCTGVAFGVFTV